MNETTQYRSFLLRMWRESDQWRYSLDDPRTQQREGFADLVELVAFLRQIQGDTQCDE